MSTVAASGRPPAGAEPATSPGLHGMACDLEAAIVDADSFTTLLLQLSMSDGLADEVRGPVGLLADLHGMIAQRLDAVHARLWAAAGYPPENRGDLLVSSPRRAGRAV